MDTPPPTGKQPSGGASPQQPPPHFDQATKEKLHVVQQMGDAAFEENTKILRKIMLRGLRAIAVVGCGLVAFNVAMKRKKAQLQREEEEAALANGTSTSNDDDPTQRYLNEMRSIGFDVDGLEEEIAKRDEELKRSSMKRP